MRHKIKHSFWENGRLNVRVSFYDGLNEAHEFLEEIKKTKKKCSVKIYNINDELVFDTDCDDTETYA